MKWLILQDLDSFCLKNEHATCSAQLSCWSWYLVVIVLSLVSVWIHQDCTCGDDLLLVTTVLECTAKCHHRVSYYCHQCAFECPTSIHVVDNWRLIGVCCCHVGQQWPSAVFHLMITRTSQHPCRCDVRVSRRSPEAAVMIIRKFLIVNIAKINYRTWTNNEAAHVWWCIKV